jgi:1A family penicillin-binding protein
MAKMNKKLKKSAGHKLPKLRLPHIKLMRPDQWSRPKKHLVMIVTIVLAAINIWLFWGLPLPSSLEDRQSVSTQLLDRKGDLIYEIYSDKKRTPVKLDDIPENVKKATIAIEDKDFYKHHGFDILGIARAARNIVFQNKLQGGSTLTQQLVKITLLTPERTLKRKIREFALSVILESTYSKDKILEMYLNHIPYGSTAYGIEAASNLYFGKSAKDLNLAEASLLAGLTQAPSRYSPFGSNPDAAISRQHVVLSRMVDEGYITPEEEEEAKKTEIKYTQGDIPKAPHFALWVKEQLAEKYGDALVEQGGLRVTTTLDLELQEFSQQTVADEVAKLTKQKVGNGAAIITRPGSGEILAMVGSKDYFAEDEDGKVNIIFAKRQPGSSIKPFNYALAIKDQKITASTAFADIPTCFTVTGQTPYCPVNYDGGYHGLVQTRFALGNSYNVPAVRTLALNGLQNFIDFAKSMGITTFEDPSRYGLSLTLGGGEIIPADMAVAFGTLANGGVKQPLVSVLKVEDWQGKVYEELDVDNKEGDRVLSSEVSFIISHILHDNNARVAAFGERSFLNVSGHSEVSVKTGTTNDRRDNWTVGYTSQIVALTWVGNNDNSPMAGAVSGVSGASPIWNRIMKHALDKSEKGFYNEDDDGHAWPKQPSGVVGANICTSTGILPQTEGENAGCATRFEYFVKGTVPATAKLTRQDIQIDKTNGGQATPETPPENIETQSKLMFYDPLNTAVCVDCASIASQSATIRYPLRRE